MTAPLKQKYEYDIDPQSDSAGARVLGMIPGGSKVLELGAGPGPMTRHLTGHLACDVVALEVDQEAIGTLSKLARSVHSLDLNSPDWDATLAAAEGAFDIAIAADVLEHLYDPWTALGKMKGLINATGSIILSLPHAGHCTLAACLMDGDFEYRDWGLLDRTHIRFFGLKNVQELHRSQSLAIEEAYFVVRTPEMTEFCHRWRRMPKHVRAALTSNRFAYVYQIVTRAVPQERARRSLKLTDIKVALPPAETIAYWSGVMKRLPLRAEADLTSTIDATPKRKKRSILSRLMGRKTDARR